MIYAGVLEHNAVDRVRQALPVFGRDRTPVLGDARNENRSLPAQSRDSRPTDATGLSVSQEDITANLAALEREQAARAPETAYRDAGARAARTIQEEPALFGSMLGSVLPSSGTPAASAPPQDARPVQTAEQQTASNETAAAMQAAGQEGRSATRTFMGDSESAADEHAPEEGGDGAEGKTGSGGTQAERGADGKDLNEEEKAEVKELKARDQEVRTHEQAHISASGGLSMGGASYERQRGPDGRMYAVGGEVQIDTSEGTSPEDTISKAQQIRRAALAPAEPSGQDRQVAARAAQMEADARQEKAKEAAEGGQSTEPAQRDKGTEAASGERTGIENEDRQASAQGTGRLSMRMEHARAMYAQAAGERGSGPWSAGYALAV
jgi:SprA-related family.